MRQTKITIHELLQKTPEEIIELLPTLNWKKFRSTQYMETEINKQYTIVTEWVAEEERKEKKERLKHITPFNLENPYTYGPTENIYDDY